MQAIQHVGVEHHSCIEKEGDDDEEKDQKNKQRKELTAKRSQRKAHAKTKSHFEHRKQQNNTK